jgi:uncharacterized protein
VEQELNTIYEAQKIDLKIIEKERVLLLTPKIIREMDDELQATRTKVEKEKEIIEELEKERKKKEKELETDKDKIKKLEAKLYEVKTNKEYQALLKEIEAAKSANDRTEEDILVLMDKAEDIRKDYNSSLVHLKEREKEIETKKIEIEKDIQSMDKIITELKTERDNLLSVVNERLRSTYVVLREKRNGIAVSTAKNGVCLGCFMNIPPQLFIEVTKNRQMIQCPSCGRILFFSIND